jgi:hypothetical protein
MPHHGIVVWEITISMSLCSGIITRMIAGRINMTFTLCRSHTARRWGPHLLEGAAARFFRQSIVVIPLATVLPRTVLKCKVALIGGGADCTTRSHSCCCFVVVAVISVCQVRLLFLYNLQLQILQREHAKDSDNLNKEDDDCNDETDFTYS